MIGSDSRSFDIAELRPFDLDLWVAFDGAVPDFTSDMLPFSIAIGPDEQCSGIPRLIFNILCDIFLVLHAHVSPCSSAEKEGDKKKGSTYIRNKSQNRS